MRKLLIKDVDIIKERQTIKKGCIIAEGETLTYVGEMPDKEKLEMESFDYVIDGNGKIAIPGLVNGHSHSPMTLFRNYADDLAFSDWLFGRIIPAEEKLTKEAIYNGAMLAMAEMIKSGTTAFMDMYMHMEQVCTAVEETGMKACVSKDILTSAVRGGELVADEQGFRNFFNEWNNGAQGRIKVNMEVHSVYLYNEKALREAAAVAKIMETPIHIHLLESPTERENSIQMYGMDPLDACLSFGLLEVPVCAAHCVHLSEENISIMKDKRISAIHNPTSNLKLGNGIADVRRLLKEGINVALGTDGAASNNNLNMFEEMHLAALLHKGVQKDPTAVTAAEVLEMATVNGARAIGFADTGILKEGMKADIVLLDANKPHIQPLNGHIAALAYSLQGGDVDTVIINGKIIMKTRELKTIDEEKVIFEAGKSAEKIFG